MDLYDWFYGPGSNTILKLEFRRLTVKKFEKCIVQDICIYWGCFANMLSQPQFI